MDLEKEEDFEKSFNEASVETDGKKVETEEKKEVDTKDTKTVDTKVADPKEGEDGKGKKEEIKPTYEELDQKYKSLQGMFEKVSTDLEELKKPKEVEIKEEKPKVEPKPEEEVPDVELDKYVQEYDYIAKNQEKLTAKQLKKVLSDFAENFKKELTEKYDITIKNAEKLILEKQDEDAEFHLVSIHEAHEDYGTEKEKEAGKQVFTRKDVVEWVETLSPMKKRECKAVLEDGSTEEVIDLLSAYKEAKGIVTKKEDVVEDPDKEKAEKEKEIKHKKLTELETVKNKKSVVGTSSTKKAEDFDGAFDEAIENQK